MTIAQGKSVGRKILRNLLVFFLLYGASSYSISLFEYTYFNLTGTTIFGIQKSFDHLRRDELIDEFKRCGGPLFGANALETEKEFDKIIVRCGRFWPFYRYSLEMPATDMIPGAFIKNPDEPETVTQTKETLIQNTFIINGAFFIISIVVFSISVFSAYTFTVKKDEEKGFKRAFHAFVSSFIMTVTFVSMMFFVDPIFSLGW